MTRGYVVTVPAVEVRAGDGYKGLTGRAKAKPVHKVSQTDRFVYLHLPRTTVLVDPDRLVSVERVEDDGEGR